MSAKRRNSGRNTETVSILFIVLIFLAAMSIQIYKLKERDALLAEREQNLEQQLSEEQDRAEELKELDLYTKTEAYIKEMANRMGLVFDNEIIFKERGE